MNGLFYGGGFDQLGKQAVGAFAVLFYSLIVAFIIGYAIKFTMGFRVSQEDEVLGVDLAEHAESAYEFGDSGGGGVFAGMGHGHLAARAEEN